MSLSVIQLWQLVGHPSEIPVVDWGASRRWQCHPGVKTCGRARLMRVRPLLLRRKPYVGRSLLVTNCRRQPYWFVHAVAAEYSRPRDAHASSYGMGCNERRVLRIGDRGVDDGDGFPGCYPVTNHSSQSVRWINRGTDVDYSGRVGEQAHANVVGIRSVVYDPMMDAGSHCWAKTSFRRLHIVEQWPNVQLVCGP